MDFNTLISKNVTLNLAYVITAQAESNGLTMTFYVTSGNSDCDMFRYVENAKLYVPGANELFQYNKPSQRIKEQKLSLSKRIAKGKE